MADVIRHSVTRCEGLEFKTVLTPVMSTMSCLQVKCRHRDIYSIHILTVKVGPHCKGCHLCSLSGTEGGRVSDL